MPAPLTANLRYEIASRQLVFALAAMAAAVAVGCGQGQGIPETTIRSAEDTLDAGLAAFENEDYPTAEQELAAALELGGLQPDLYTQACVARSLSLGHLGQVTDALLQLSFCEEGLAGPAAIDVLKAQIHLAAGDKAAAKEHLELARQANANIDLPEELQALN